jgi:glycosyltransferase involved in cell wall biosynthesis
LVTTFHSKYRDDFITVTGSPTLAEVGVRYVVDFYEKATQVWAPNRSTAQTLEDYGFRGRIEVVPNGTDLEAPTREEKARYAEGGRAAAGATDADLPIYLFVGQHRWEKNVELIMRTLAFIKGRGARFRMVFAGTGYAEKAMKRMCKSLGIAEETVFLGLILDRERLKELYAAATLLLFPSLYDNAPLVMREAAGFEVPTVLIRGASAAEGVTDRDSGFLVENTPESLAAALQGAAADPELTARVGRGARRDIYLHWRDVVADVYRRYEDIVTTNGRHSVHIDNGIES